MLDLLILLLDELTSLLDAKTCAKIENLLIEPSLQHPLLVVFRYQNQVQRVADRVYELAYKQQKRIC